MRTARRGFTLVELLVVIAIIGILVGLLIPAVQAVRAKAALTKCTSNANQLALALIEYSQSKQKLPGWRNHIPSKIPYDSSGYAQQLSWVIPLLPRTDQNQTYDGVLQQQTGFEPGSIEFLVCPADSIKLSGGTQLSYVCNSGYKDDVNQNPRDWIFNGMFMDRYYFNPADKSNNVPPTADTKIDQVTRWDGVTQTALLSENVDAGLYYKQGDKVLEAKVGMVWSETMATVAPPQLARDPRRAQYDSSKDDFVLALPSSNHSSGVCVVAFCDRHVAQLSPEVDYAVYVSMLTPRKDYVRRPGESVPQLDFYANDNDQKIQKKTPITDADLNP